MIDERTAQQTVWKRGSSVGMAVLSKPEQPPTPPVKRAGGPATDTTTGRGRIKIACVVAGVLGGVLGQALGATLIFVNAIRFGDYRTIPAGSALFLFSWIGFVGALATVRHPRTAGLIQLGAIIGLIVVALVARIWSLSLPVALLALCGGMREGSFTKDMTRTPTIPGLGRGDSRIAPTAFCPRH